MSDFYEKIQQTTQALKERDFSAIDLDFLVDEVEDMGKSELRALKSMVNVLIEHRLKLLAKPDHIAVRRWKITIENQMDGIKGILDDSPSLKNKLGKTILSEYSSARKKAMIALDVNIPQECLFSEDDLLRDTD